MAKREQQQRQSRNNNYENVLGGPAGVRSHILIESLMSFSITSFLVMGKRTRAPRSMALNFQIAFIRVVIRSMETDNRQESLSFNRKEPENALFKQI